MTQPNGRDQAKSDILSLLITKHNTSCSVADLRTEIDKKAKEIGLKPNERTELILEMRKIVEIKEMIKEEEMSE